MDKVEGRGYKEIPLAWRASGLPRNFDEIVFRYRFFTLFLYNLTSFLRADIVSNDHLYRVKSVPLKEVSLALFRNFKTNSIVFKAYSKWSYSLCRRSSS